LSGNADLVDFEEDSSNNLYLFGHFSGGITDVDDNTLILPNIHNSSQGFIIKLDASEQYDWIKHIEAYGDGIQFPGFAASDMQIKDDNVLIAAGIKGKFDILNLNNQTMFVENPNNWINSLFVKYSPSGNVLWKFIYEGQSANKVVSIKSFNNYFYTFGLFKDQTDFNSHPWFPFYMNSTNNSSDFFFAKYNDIFILNPSLGNTNYGLDKNSLVTVEKGNNNFDLWMLGSQDEIFLFKVYDLSGRLITVGSFLKLNDDFYSSLDMSGMSAGVYIVKVNGLGLTHLPLTARIIVK
ncbi:MAG: T9SS type A sorting domain-containing protein, partial [Flavobacteriaceae bacterium]